MPQGSSHKEASLNDNLQLVDEAGKDALIQAGQPIPQCSSCSVAVARFRDGLPSMSLRQELTIEPEDLQLELWTSAMNEASISRLRMHRFWRRAPRATRS